MQELLQLDHSLLFLINKTWAHPALDAFFPVWTDLHKTSFFQFLFLPVILAIIFWRARWSGLVFFFFAAVAVGINDGILGKVVKQFFMRLRPSVQGLDVVVRAPHFGGFSFPSIHAADTFCLAIFVGCYFPKLRWPLLTISALTGYSRVYCGVHFPSDVFGGYFMGGLIALALAFLFRPVWNWIETRLHPQES